MPTERTHLIHEYGDLILTIATSGRVRAYEVDADGGLIEQDPATATMLRTAREVAASEVERAR
jgi:hypothetical protein